MTTTTMEEMYAAITPKMEEIKARYPRELNIEGLEPALTSDVAEICLEQVKLALQQREEELRRKLGVYITLADGHELIDSLLKPTE